MSQSELVGFARMGKNTLNLSISAEAFEKAERYATKSGEQFVRLSVSAQKLNELVAGKREVTSVVQFRGLTP